MISHPANAQQNRITSAPDDTQMVVLQGTVPSWVKPEHDLGPLNPSTKFNYVTLLVQPTAAQETARKQLTADQQNPRSEKYHKWLTPEEYGDRFGLSRPDVAQIQQWLGLQGFTVVEVARARNWIAFSGTVGQIEQAFHIQMHHFMVNGEDRFSNTTDPSIPKALQGIVYGFRGLEDFRAKPMMIRKSPKATPQYSDGFGDNYLAPDDIATIYDISALYASGIDGTGMKIAIIGQTDVHSQDIQEFRDGFNLPTNNFTTIIPPSACQDPGFTGDEGEADLDLEWSGAVARNAAITFVTCDVGHNGVIGALVYAVNNNLAPVISMSYGSCEAGAPANFVTAYQQLVQQANTQGQTLMVSSGDSGAATCDGSGSPEASKGLGVNILASPPEVTAVGGTEFSEGAGTYWSSSNGTNGGSALSYIPEFAWDDSAAGTELSGGLSSTGGGLSIYFQKPAWQTGPGTFDPTWRSVPDVAMPASANHDGYIFCTNEGGASYSGSCANGIATAVNNGSIVGGTSVACPVFAGIVTLLNQSLKNSPPAGLGNINPSLYPLAANVPTAFHDVPAGTYSFAGAAANPSGNMVPCQVGTQNCTTGTMGFLTDTGYDPVTGLGSVDANILIGNWGGGPSLTPTTTTLVISSGGTVTVGTSVTATATISPAPPDGETVTFHLSGGITGSATATTTGGSAAVTVQTGSGTSQIPGGTYAITASYPGDTTLAASSSTSSALNVQDFTIGPGTLSVTVSAPGQNGVGTITVGMLGGLSTAPSFACSGLPAESSCTFTAASSTSETVTIGTTAASSLVDGPFGPRNRIFYALLFPAAFGLLLPASRRRSKALTMMSLVAVLALATLCLPACSSSSGGGGHHDPGTPTGQSSVTVTATDSTLTHNITVTLNVQ